MIQRVAVKTASLAKLARAQRATASATLAIALLLFVPIAGATTRSVVGCADDGSPGSLRSVIASSASGDIVDLTGLACSAVSLVSGELVVAVDDLSIIGPGMDSLAIDAGHTSRVFRHAGLGTLSLSGMTIEHGSVAVDDAPARGGCIDSIAAVVLDRTKVTGCTVSGNTSPAGGAVHAAGELTLTDSVLSSNSVVKTGAVAAYPSATGGGASAHTLTVRRTSITANSAVDDAGGNAAGGGVFAELLIFSRYSTFDHNIANYGGGIAMLAENQTVFSLSTISSNSASADGGGVYGTSVNLFSSTISANTSGGRGGGVFGPHHSGFVALTDSIVSGNSAVDTANSDIDGESTETQGSVIVSVDAHDILGNTQLMLLGSTDPIRSDPLLGPLADNGGPTRTHEILAGSPALDAGSGLNAPLSGYCDQRQLPRKRGAGADIGSYEDQGDTVFYGSFDNCT